MNQYKVVSEDGIQANGETHLKGAIVELEAGAESVIKWLEEGVIELFSGEAGESSQSTDAQQSEEETQAQAEEATKTEQTQAEEKPTEPEKPSDSSLSDFQKKYPTPPASFSSVLPAVYAFCMGIQNHEGYFAPGENEKFPLGTPAWINKNPGNLKFRNQPQAHGESAQGFAIFPTYEAGFEALVSQVMLACQNKSAAYRPSMTFLQFFAVYASTPGDKPEVYAAEVAKEMNLPESTIISALIS